MKKTTLEMIAKIIGLVIGLVISFFLNAGIVWIACTGLTLIGIKVTFHWKMVILFMICVIITKGIKKVIKKDKKL